MANRLAEAMGNLRDRLREQAGYAAVYREESISCNLTVTKGRSLLKLTDEHGRTQISLQENDWFLPVEDLALGGVATEPKDGAKLDVTFPDGTVRRYELARPGINEPCFKRAQHGTVFRVHTKFLEVL